MIMRAPAPVESNQSLTGAIAFPRDWRPRFAEAYRLQNQAWVRAIATGAFASDGASGFWRRVVTTSELRVAVGKRWSRGATPPI